MDRQSDEPKASLENRATQNRTLNAVVETSDIGTLVVDREAKTVS